MSNFPSGFRVLKPKSHDLLFRNLVQMQLINLKFLKRSCCVPLIRQRGQMGKGIVFTTTLIEWSGFNPHPGHVVASLMDKTLYNDYLCLVASNKQQIQ